MALRDAEQLGNSVHGATAYVTLEPCSHHGRTGPCCDALISAGIKRVVATNTDPNPLVAVLGFARLRTAGVEVEVLAADDPLAIASRELNIGFFSRMVRKQPWGRMKIAASLDGKTALTNGASQWITSPEARADGHAWRARLCGAHRHWHYSARPPTTGCKACANTAATPPLLLLIAACKRQ
jgi:diaminohydroxyphosphoribosylaminopyrimidine deaminase/5-amino-6-(5-phosphoribosylamino)uracil reductase